MVTITETQPQTKRPKILDEILDKIDGNVRKEEIVKAKRDLEAKVMERLANIRLQESIVEQKVKALDARPTPEDDDDEKVIVQLEMALTQAELYLEDLYQGGVALSEELLRANEALDEMATAGLAPYGNRSQRRSKNK